MASLLSHALAPRFHAVLASAWISKRVAAKYVQEYVGQVQAEGKKEQGSRKTIAFAPPIQVQVLEIGDGSPYEALDVVNGGEDSLFHARVKQNLVYGVSDGVGGWNSSGIDPSIFSRSLTAYSAAAAERSFLLHDSDEADPKDIMRRAYAAMRYDGIPAYGSATELVMGLSLASGKLRTAQLGDSTYVILDSKQRARYVSTEQQHQFNTPYQLTIPPEHGAKRRKSRSENEEDPESTQYFRPAPAAEISAEVRAEIEKDDFADLAAYGLDSPADARENSHTLEHNEVVVAATDGLYDNVRVDEVEKLAERYMLAIDKVQSAMPKTTNGVPAVPDLFGGLAYSIAAQAVGNYIQKDLRSPFAERAKLAGMPFTGGKPDDVTVMLTWVRDAARVDTDARARELRAKL